MPSGSMQFGNYQIHLWDDTEEMINLYQAIDSVKRRFGEGVLLRGGGMPLRTDATRSGLDEKMPVGRMRRRVKETPPKRN